MYGNPSVTTPLVSLFLSIQLNPRVNTDTVGLNVIKEQLGFDVLRIRPSSFQMRVVTFNHNGKLSVQGRYQMNGFVRVCVIVLS